MGTTTPFPPASQLVVLGQATPRSSKVPDTVTGLPGTPLEMGTTTPVRVKTLSTVTWVAPTASQLVVLGQATPKS